MANSKNFYWVEIDADTATALSSACETFSSIIAGKLDIVEELVIQAYKKRMGKEPDDVACEQVRNALKLIQYIGWDTTLGNPVNVHGYSPLTDTLCGITDVFSYQLCDDGVRGFENARYPIQWNDKIPLPRIVKKCTSVYNRRKQLQIFPKK